MRITAITCLPSLAVTHGEISLGGMRIAPLDFDHWLELEGEAHSAAYNKLESRYRRDPPFFLHQPIDADLAVSADPGEARTRALMDAARPGIEAVARALHFYIGAPPIDPHLSVTYFQRSANEDDATDSTEAWVGDGGAPRVYGESGNEYAIQNQSPAIVLDSAEEAALGRMLAFVLRSRPIWSDARYDLAWRSLAISAAPGLGWPSRVLMTVGAIEALVMPELKEGLQAAFIRRVAVLAARDAARAAELRSLLRSAYRIRSDLVHGRALAENLAKLPVDPGEFLEHLGRTGVAAICRLISLCLVRGGPMSDDLGAILDSADPAEIDAMLGPAGARAPHRWERARC